jgi:hypothetical protein
VDPERSHHVSIQCIISGRGGRQGAYNWGKIFSHLSLGKAIETVNSQQYLYFTTMAAA